MIAKVDWPFIKRFSICIDAQGNVHNTSFYSLMNKAIEKGVPMKASLTNVYLDFDDVTFLKPIEISECPATGFMIFKWGDNE